MEVNLDPVLDVIAQRDAQAAAEQQKAVTQGLGRDEFLKLLIAQLENQDPLEPAKDTEFVAQMATFSSLEQLITANDNLEALALGQTSLVNSQALNLIGKSALVEAGSQLRVVNGRPEDLVYILPEPAQSAQLTLYASDGTPVHTVELQTTPNGRVSIDWDGEALDPEALPDGDYRIEISASDANGEPIPVALFKSLPIDGVNFNDGGFTLVSGDREIPFQLILEIRS